MMLSINHIAECHDGKDIIFCKTDYILDDFQTIKEKNYINTIFVTGNSDYPITDKLIEMCPKNITKWYAENAMTNHSKIIPIPIGIENQFECKRFGHGTPFIERYNKKYEIINNLLKNKKEPTKFIYSNFSTYTNPKQREPLKQLSIESSYITWSEPNLSYENLYKQIFDHKMVLCPVGNGLDTHRLWETLYCNRIPITIKIGNYKLYELYSKLPIILLDSIEQLHDKKYIENCYHNIKNQNYPNLNNILTDKFWIDLIKRRQTLDDFQ